MGVTIQDFTYKYPIQMIGTEAGVCYGSDITNAEKNYKRGIDCLESQHGRTWEFPDVYMILDDYSARVLREWYTHIGGLPYKHLQDTSIIKKVLIISLHHQLQITNPQRLSMMI